MNYKVVSLLAALIAVCSVVVVTGKPLKVPRPVKGLFDKPHCFLTLNEVSVKESENEVSGREMELNWVNVPGIEGDWIGLFPYDPLTNPPSTNHRQRALRSYNLLDSPGSGYIKTDVRLPPMNYTPYGDGDECQHYWVAYFRSDNISGPVVSNCFRLYPRWMSERSLVIGDVPLTSLMIPGTHDAGAWRVYDGNNDNIITKYVYTQEESPYNQMVSGIRYFDLRPAYYPNDEETHFWINHGDFKVMKMEDFLSDAVQFVQEFNEVLILDFHEFPVGFSDSSVHELVYEFVSERLGDYLAPRIAPKDATLNQLWMMEKPIVWTYNDNGFYKTKPNLWEPLNHAWGDKNTVESLHEYLPTAIAANGCSGKWWSAMAEITPSVQDIIFKPNYGLRRFAYDVNKPLNYWYRDPAWYSKSNVVSTDFYKGNDVVEVCVKVNENRGVTC